MATSRPMSAMCLPALAVLLLTACVQTAGGTAGAIPLDSLTFDRVVDGSRAVLVKFDKQFPYGDQAEQFGEFSRSVAGSDLWVGEVNVQDYGDKNNDDLRLRYFIDTEDYPVFLLFPASRTPVLYEGEVTAAALSRFVNAQSGVSVGLQGTIQTLDDVAASVVRGTMTVEAALSKVDAVGREVAAPSNQESILVYGRILKKMQSVGPSFPTSEIQRVSRLLENDLSSAKRQMMEIRLNILASFQLPASVTHDDEEMGDSTAPLSDEL